MKLAGVLLMIAGLAALIYGGIRYSTEKRAVDLGPLKINKTEHHTIPLPPLLGIVMVASGGALLFAAGRSGR